MYNYAVDVKLASILQQNAPMVTVGAAKADYVTNGVDDNVQIQNAIDYAVIKGIKEVKFLSETTFLISGTINVPNNIVLRGGINTLIKKDPTASPTFLNNSPMLINASGFSGAKNIRIEDINFEGYLAGTYPTQIGASDHIYFYARDESNLVFRNLTFKKGNVGSINLNPVFSASAPNGICYVYSNVIMEKITTETVSCGAGLVLGTGGADITIDRYLGGSRDTAIALFEPQGAFTITNCIIDGTGSYSGQGIEFSVSQSLLNKGGVVTNNIIKNYRGNGIYMSGRTNAPAFYPENIIISNNIIFGNKPYTGDTANGGHGMLISGGRNITISNNIVFNNDRNGISNQVGSSGEFKTSKIINNTVYNNGQLLANTYAGISIGVESEGKMIGNEFSNNSIYDDQSTKTQSYGIELKMVGGYPVSTYLSGNSIRNNNISGNLNSGIQYTSTITPIIDIKNNNTIIGNSINPVDVSTTQTLTNKTLNLTLNTLQGTIAQFNAAVSDGDFVTITGVETLTNKSINLASNVLSGTAAQFNAAIIDNDFATLNGAETLQNKGISLSLNNLTGTTNEFNAALTDGNFATIDGAHSLFNKTQIGVGTGAPADLLHVKGGNVTGIRVESTSSCALVDLWSNSGRNFSWRTNFNIPGLELTRSTTIGGNPTTTALHVDVNGNMKIGGINATEKLEVAGNILSEGYKVTAMQSAPLTASSTGVLGDIRITADYVYVCTAANTWKRTALTTF